MTSLEDRIKNHARQLGFDLVGIAEAAEADTFADFLDWLGRDYAGRMNYMHRHTEARRHPSSILDEVRTIIMVAMNYKTGESGSETPARDDGRLLGKVARYARGQDYHDVLWAKLNSLLEWLQKEVPGCKGRGVVDTAPLLERDFARRAGLGWFGKNTMLLNKELGSYFFLGALLVDIPLRPDAPHAASHCGNCTACLDACPTDAFPAPGQLDSRRCISYLTIELKDEIPEDLRPLMGDWLFGCDICQEVCPWNRKAPPGHEPALQPHADLTMVDLLELFQLSPEAFREKFRGTALTRPRRRGLLRNAAIALGNLGEPAALPVLQQATEKEEPLVQEAAKWAIEQIRCKNSQMAQQFGNGGGENHVQIR